MFCPHQTSWSLRKTPGGSGRGRWGPSRQGSPGLPATLAFSKTAKNFCLARGNRHILSVLRKERPFPKRGRPQPPRALPGAACCPWLEGCQQYLGTVSPLSWWGDERAGAAATLTALSVTLSFLIHRSAGVCINILRSGRIDDCFRNFAPGVVR